MTVVEARTAEPLVPRTTDLKQLAEAACGCRGCDLYKYATQTVFGEGSRSARLVLVGEQPGDKEDVAGRPFVGPAGAVMDKALKAAGIDRRQTYVTNAVKHFKFVQRGKRRIHQGPKRTEIVACRPWLIAELLSIQPEVVVPLGSTAVQSLLGPQARVTQLRGQDLETEFAPHLVPTIHPSAILRVEDLDERQAAFEGLVADLKVAAEALAA